MDYCRWILQAVKTLHGTRMEMGLPWKYGLTCILIPGGSILLIYNIIKLTRLAINTGYAIYSITSVFIILLLNVISFTLYRYLLEKEKNAEQQNITCERQMLLYKVKNEETEENWNKLKKFRHDYVNHLICIREYLNRENSEAAEKYVNTLLKSIKGEQGIKNVSNSFVDIFLEYKIKNEKIHHISFTTNIVIPKQLLLDEADLCIIIGNAFDNAAEAVKRLPEPKRNIDITIEYWKHTLKIIIKNPYNGDIKTDRKGRIMTTKTDGGSHGIGIASMEKIVKRYNGLLDMTYTSEIFVTKILLYEK